MPLQLPTLRHALRQPLVNPRATQRRWAQVQDVRRFLVTHDSQERILAKYREKLESKAKEKGLRDLNELREQYKDKIEELRKQAIVPGATGPLTPPLSPQQTSASPQQTNSPSDSKTTNSSAPKSPWPSPPPPPGSGSPSAPPPGVKTLNSFLDLDKVRTLPEKEVQALWRLRHAGNPQSIHFAVPANTFSQLLRSAKQHPSFVLPVPRQIPVDSPSADGQAQTQQAAELHYLQFLHPHVDTTTLMFTTLAEFKLRGEFASPHTTITFHQELTESHNLVLGQGLVIENRGVSLDEARWLVMCMQKFYVQTAEGKGRSELLDMFTRGDSGFQVDRLIDEAEKIL
ncbi:F1F0 ATP synthase assembly protein Atp11 [Pyrenophora tritici-repentis]|uniref:F1F0 ATP synthase assembly protein Atp11 n=1 Tax=Pyrenophora tritici-repentis TaxID=45151 RepID=A0A922T3I2_9PLEO|nr:F1F0 ATP synthase assembly protein Atp11 [Pyrenophora tritici-repentis]